MGVPSPGLQCIVLGKKYDIMDPKVMDHVAKCGYTSVECGAGDPRRLKAMLDERGMSYGGMHTTVQKLQDIGPIVDALGVLECQDLCNSGLYTWDNPGADDFRKAIETFNKAGAELRKAGIHLHYHNHDFEFRAVEGDTRGIDILLEELDPSACDLCVDVAWVTKGNDTPVEFLKRHDAMTGYVHLKDYDGEGWTELGSGVVDIAGVVKLLPELKGVRTVMCEQDSSRIDPLESVAKSRAYLKEKLGY